MRVSSEHWVEILEFCKNTPELMKSKLYGFEARQRAHYLWSDLTQRLNSMGCGEKTRKEWKKTVADWKSKTKKKAEKLRQQLESRSEEVTITLSNYELRLLQLMKISIEGLSNFQMVAIKEKAEDIDPLGDADKDADKRTCTGDERTGTPIICVEKAEALENSNDNKFYFEDHDYYEPDILGGDKNDKKDCESNPNSQKTIEENESGCSNGFNVPNMLEKNELVCSNGFNVPNMLEKNDLGCSNVSNTRSQKRKEKMHYSLSSSDESDFNKRRGSRSYHRRRKRRRRSSSSSDEPSMNVEMLLEMKKINKNMKRIASALESVVNKFTK